MTFNVTISGNNTSITVTPAGNNGTVSYQWQLSDDGTTGWASITGATGNSINYINNSSYVGKYLRVIATDTGSGTSLSNIAVIHVYYDSDGTTIRISIDMGNDVTSVGQYAFNNCSNLTSVSMPQVITVMRFAFNSCSSLTSISMPQVITVDQYAFDSCSSLTSVSMPQVITVMRFAFNSCSSLTSVSMPLVSSVSNDAFNSCSSLTSVSMPAVTSVGNFAFFNCSLTSVSMPAVTSVGSYAFISCSNLTSVSMPLVTTIGQNAFASCTSLAYVFFQQNYSAITFGADAFSNIKSGATAYYLSTSTGWSSTLTGFTSIQPYSLYTGQSLTSGNVLVLDDNANIRISGANVFLMGSNPTISNLSSGSLRAFTDATITSLSGDSSSALYIESGVSVTVGGGSHNGTISGASGTLVTTGDLVLNDLTIETLTIQSNTVTTGLSFLSTISTINLGVSGDATDANFSAGSTVADVTISANINALGSGVNTIGTNNGNSRNITYSGTITKNGTALVLNSATGVTKVTGKITGANVNSDADIYGSVKYANATDFENDYNGPTTIHSGASLTLDTTSIPNSDVTVENNGSLIVQNTSMPDDVNIKTVLLEANGALDLTAGYIKTTGFTTTGSVSISMTAGTHIAVTGNVTLTGDVAINVSGAVTAGTTYDLITCAGIYSGTFSANYVGNTHEVSAGEWVNESGVYKYRVTIRGVATISNIAVQPKEYDALLDASVTGVLNGIEAGHNVTLNTLTGQFNTKNVGNGKTVTVTGTLTGTDAGNYRLVQPTGSYSADITALSLHVTGATAANKPYDATRDASISGGVISAIAGDTVALDTSNRAGLFADKNIGTGKSVTVSGYTLSGIDAGNYALVQPTGLTADITALSLHVTGATAANKEYNATRTATISSGVISKITGDNVTLVNSGRTGLFADKNIGTGKSVTVSGYTLSGTDAGNYNLVQPSGVTANITAKPLTITNISAASKQYDATRTATMSGSLPDVISPDAVTLTLTGEFNTKDVGTGKPVTVTAASISGNDATNYSLIPPSGSYSANITAKPLPVTGVTAADKPFDTTTTATISGGAISPIDGDIVTLITTNKTGRFENYYVANNKNVIVSGYTISGTHAGNYALVQPTGVTASITPAITATVCFPAGTPVLTNQGYVSIEQIDPAIHTVRNKPVIAITQTVTEEKHLIRIAKHALGNNYPSKTTLISQNHQLMFMGQMIKAKDLVGLVNHVTRVPYHGTPLYNVLLETHDKMQVNNLIVETLHPEHKVAQLYHLLQTAKPEERPEMIVLYNQFERQYKASLQK